jgi:hypothetical protein
MAWLSLRVRRGGDSSTVDSSAGAPMLIDQLLD